MKTIITPLFSLSFSLTLSLAFYSSSSAEISLCRMDRREIVFPAVDEKSMEKCWAAAEAEEAAQRQSHIFVHPHPEGIGKCLCGCCKDVGGQRPQYCCGSLQQYSRSLTFSGRSMLSSLTELCGHTWEGCISSQPAFSSLFLDDQARISFRYAETR